MNAHAFGVRAVTSYITFFAHFHIFAVQKYGNVQKM